MTVSISIPSDLETELASEASELKLPLDEYILRILSKRPPLSNSPKNGAELIAYWKNEGVIGSRPDILDSQKHSRKLRHQAENRKHN